MKTFFQHKIGFLFLCLCLGLYSCKVQQTSEYSKRLNLSFLYNPNLQRLKANVVIHNTKDSLSTVHCLIPTNQLLYRMVNEQEIASLQLHYQLYKISNGLVRIDSSTYTRSLIKDTTKAFEYFTIALSIKDTGVFMLDLSIQDKNKHTTYHNYFDFERKTTISRNDLLITNKNGLPYPEKWLSDSDTFKITLRKGLPTEWKFSYFSNVFKPASPPYSMTTNKDYLLPSPDSIRVKLICDTCFFVLNRKGILHIYRDSMDAGTTIFNFPSSYPQMKRPSELLQPIRLLVSQKEFNELNIVADKKESVDKFWLSTTSNIDRARELIRVFYSRVFLANQYFTSYTEGWKTDRGIIYIIFGLPTTIYKAPTVEQWIYGTPESSKVLVFNFIKKRHPFSDNHYVLDRNESYKISWLQAIDTWRNGRMFSILANE